jgi:hypothetical protein
MPDTETPAPAMPGESATTTEIAERVTHAPAAYASPGYAVMSDDEIRRTWRLAAALASSRMFKDAVQAEQAFAKILIGRDLGISPTQALMAVDLVEGAIMLRGILLARFLREHPTYDYRLKDHTAEACTCIIERKRDGEWSDVGEWTFTIADAEVAGLIKSDKPKAAWNAHRKNMLMWRAIANATRAHAPDVFGGVPVYVEGEIEREPEITAGDGDGRAQGLDLGPDVEAVLQRAAELGHAGLAERATVEMTLGGQPPGKVVEWVAIAKRELDELEASTVAGEAEEVVDGEPEAPEGENPAPEGAPSAPDERPEAPEGGRTTESDPSANGDSEPLDVEAERAAVRDLLDEADAADAEGDEDRAEELRGEAIARADRLPPETDAEQGSLDL